MSKLYIKRILDELLDKYENSKSFTGDNKVNQNFSLNISKKFPVYLENTSYESYVNINNSIEVLIINDLIYGEKDRTGSYKNIYLNTSNLSKAYDYINRVPKNNINREFTELLDKYIGRNKIIDKYSQVQVERIRQNKSIEFFNKDIKEMELILLAIDEILKVENETFIRDFSIKIFKDSKTFEKISNKVVSILFKYGDFPEKESVLSTLNIIKNPSYVNFKGAGKIFFKNQTINLELLSGDIGISAPLLEDIEKIEVIGGKLITIENLTSFNSFNTLINKDYFAIYLGGYHNKIRRDFIKRIFKYNPHIEYYHFGDIDSGGFYILEHLKRETGVDFKPYMMDIDTLKRFLKYTKKLTLNDKSRLNNLMNTPYKDTIKYMLDNNCKLEQEAVQQDRF